MEYFVHVRSLLSIYYGMKPHQNHDAVSFLFDRRGYRKYLTLRERSAFLNAAALAPSEVGTFCSVLAYTGGRISEILALTPHRIDFDAGVIVIETLKRRRTALFRAVPVPERLLATLQAVHGKSERADDSKGEAVRMWPWGRTTGWKHVKTIMKEAGIKGPQASPKGLRHTFGVLSLQSGVSLNLVNRWLGHARLDTTAIYGDAIGEEERSIAQRFWSTF